MGAAIDIVGQRFGRLVVLGKDSRQGHFRCTCDCGAETSVRSDNLRYGRVVSCGCLGQSARLTHGHTAGRSKSSTYVVWQNMLDRCRNRANPKWEQYGGRGIAVCDRWLSFENFLTDMGERPSGLTLDRVDNDGNYEPTNCRWTTVSEQNFNRRSYSKLSSQDVATIRGRLHAGETGRVLARAFGVSTATISSIKTGKGRKSYVF
jgi:hypothetical protein